MGALIIGENEEERGPQVWVSSTGFLALAWKKVIIRNSPGFSVFEHAETQRMSSERAANFIAGRVCARAAIEALGGSSGELKRLSNGSVCWPHGWTGSITHSQGTVIVVVAKTTLLRGIGVDIEPNLPLPKDSAFVLRRDCFIGSAKKLQTDPLDSRGGR